MTEQDLNTQSRVTLGRIASAHGIKGWVNVQSFTRPPKNILNFDHWRVGDVEYALSEWRQSGERLQARLDGIDDRNAAEAMKGQWIQVDREALPEPDSGEFYWDDLVGLSVQTPTGIELGRIEGLMETGANDVLVVQGERQRLIPFDQNAVILRVDLENGVVEVDWDPEF